MALFQKISFVRASTGGVGATSDHVSDWVDWATFGGVLFQVHMASVGTATSLTLHVEQSPDQVAVSRLPGSIAWVPDGASYPASMLVADVFRPDGSLGRYLRVVLERSDTDSEVASILALRYAATAEPTSHAVGAVLADGTLISPEVTT
ncbi:MAG: hypothetical protein AAGN46_01275 [Acidobacteriota bacterium]